MNPTPDLIYPQIDAQKRAIIDPIRNKIPVDIRAVAEALDIQVQEQGIPYGVEARIRQDGSKTSIFVNEYSWETRKVFTIAHELAHYLLDHLDGEELNENDLLISRLTTTQERDANYLAAELLLPMDKIDDFLKQKQLTNISTIAKYFDVSEQALRLRLGII